MAKQSWGDLYIASPPSYCDVTNANNQHYKLYHSIQHGIFCRECNSSDVTINSKKHCEDRVTLYNITCNSCHYDSTITVGGTYDYYERHKPHKIILNNNSCHYNTCPYLNKDRFCTWQWNHHDDLHKYPCLKRMFVAQNPFNNTSIRKVRTKYPEKFMKFDSDNLANITGGCNFMKTRSNYHINYGNFG